MKIEINNLGPISKFCFDLDKDFHLIYGLNNIGKSISIHIIYILIKYFLTFPEKVISDLRFTYIKDDYENSNVFKILVNNLNYLKKNKFKARLNITDIISKILKECVDTFLLQHLQDALDNSFSSNKNMQSKFTSELLGINITLKNLNFSIRQNSNGTYYVDNLVLNDIFYLKYCNNNKKRVYSKKGIFYYIKPDHSNENNLYKEIFLYINGIFDIINDEISNSVNHVHFFPASRSGLYQALSNLNSIFAKFSQIRNTLNTKISLPSLSEPISDYFLEQSSIRHKSKPDKYSEIAKNIENNLLKSEILFQQKTNSLEYWNKELNLRLDIIDSSSMISEIAPIVAFLKYIISENINDELNNSIEKNYLPPVFKKKPDRIIKRILFIEEPEAHLHPEAQIKLLNSFCEMIDNNLKIVITTHSDIILNKVTNLILEKKIPPDKISSYHLIMTSQGSIDAEDMKATPEGINDFNFSESIESLYNERLEILGKTNNE